MALLVGCAGFPTQSEPVVVKRAQMQMGTLVKITRWRRSEAVAQAAATAGFAEIHRLEELLSTWIPTSELSRVNASAGVMPVHVSPETLTVVQRAMQVAEMTEGGFNIAIGPAVDAWSVIDGRRYRQNLSWRLSVPWWIYRRFMSTCGSRRSFLRKQGCGSM